MKILHCNSNYLLTKLHENFIDKLSSSQIENIIYMPRRRNSHTVLESKHNVFSPKIVSKLDRYFYHHRQRKMFKYYVNNVHSNDIDIVHASTLFTDGGIALKIFKMYEIPYIVTVRSTDLTFFKYRKLLYKQGLNILKNAKKIVFLSESYRELIISEFVPRKIRDEFRDKSEVIPNGIDQEWFESSDLEVKRDQSSVVYAGRIEKNKNPLLTAKAIDMLNKEGMQVTFHVAGRIVDRQIFDKLQEFDFFKYHGELDREELEELYRTCSIYSMPSYFESFGLTYVEAMSQGLPVIYTRGQGFDQQFTDGEIGYSTNSSDIYELKENITKIQNRFNELSARAKSNSRKFNWDNISRVYIEVYNSIL